MQELKYCPECQADLPIEKFKKSNKLVKGILKEYRSKVCQACHNRRMAGYRKEWLKKKLLVDPDYSNKYNRKYRATEHGILKVKEYTATNAEHQKQVAKDWYVNNKDKNRERGERWKKNNPEKYKALYSKRNHARQTDPLLNFAMRVRCSIGKSFRKNSIIKRVKTFQNLGYSNVDLHNHLSVYLGKPCEVCQLTVIDMTNCNLDHIVPMCTAASEHDVLRLNQLPNLRLICEPCNMAKISSDLKAKEEANVGLGTASS